MQRPNPETVRLNDILSAEELSRALISNLPGGATFVVDRDLRYLLAEGEALAIAGFKPEDFVGRTISEVLPPELAANYEPTYRQALAGEPFEVEHDAHEHTYISRGIPLRAEDGEVYGVLVVSYDITERKKAEVALRESEARLQAIANLVPDLLWDSEPDGSTNWYNQRWLEYTGQTFEQAIGWGWIDAIHPDDREGSTRRYREAAEQGMLLQQEHRIRRHDGAYRWFVVKAAPLKDESGKAIKMYGAATDIHEQRVALEALCESEERFRTLANTAPALIWFNDAQGNNRFINQHFLDFTGKSVEQIRGEGWQELVHPDDAEAYIADYLAAVREQRSWHNRNRIRRHDGVWRWHDNYAQPLFSTDGVYLGHVGVTIDNTEAIAAEIALQESEQRYRYLVELTPHLAWNADEQGRNTYVSPQMGMYVGLSPEQLVNLGWETVIHPEDIDRVYCAWMEAVQTGIPYEAEYRLRRADGEYRWHLVRAIFEGNGQGRKWFGVSTDIHDRKRAEDTLRESEEKYRSLFDSIDSGFCIFEMLYNEAGEAIDFRYIETNPAFERQSGRRPQPGQTMRELFPEAEDMWLKDYAEVARTGQAKRFIDHHKDLDRWFDVFVFPTSNGKNQLAALFSDVTVEKRAEATLRESEERLQKAISIETVGVLFFTLDGRITDANDTFLRLSGYSRDELRNLTDWQALTPPEFWDATSVAAEELATLGTTAPYEKQLLRKDGSRWWGLFSPTRLKGSGRSAECVEFVIDISDRKQAEKQVHRAAEMDAFRVKLADALRSLTDPMQIQAEACRLLGEQLGVDRAYYVEVHEPEGYARANQHYSRGDSPSIVENYRLAEYGWSLPIMRRGETIVITDTQSTDIIPDVERAAMARIRMIGFVAIPLIKGEVLVGSLAVNEPTPREWTEAEVGLVRETTERIWADIQRAHAETALRESEAKYRSLFNSMDEAYAVVEVMAGENGEWNDFLFLEVNPAFVKQTGMEYPVGRKATELLGTPNPQWAKVYGRVAETGEPIRFEEGEATLDRVFDLYVFRLGGEGSRRVAVLFTDITDRKRAEETLRENETRQAFLLKLSDILQQFVQPNDIKAAAMRLLGEHLGVSRAQYHECDSSGEYYSADGVGYANGLPLLDLKYRIDNFGTFVNEDFAAGRAYRIDDLEVAPRVSPEERAAYRSYQIRAGAGVPLIRGGKLVAILAIHDVHPHSWTDLEMDLIRETAERIWTPLERARAEEALRGSEEKYRSLFTSINEGFILLEMISDESGHPCNFRIVETNPIWEQQTGLTDAVGKTLLEIAPYFEQQWLDFYSDVLRSGKSRRTEYYTASVDRWYTVFASRIGGEGSHQIAVVFNDISDRKRTEEQQAFLLKFSDALRAEPDADSVANRAVQMLAEHLHLDRCWLAEVFEQQDIARIGWEYHRPDLPPTAGVYRLSDYPEIMRQIATQLMVIHDISSDPDFADSEKALLAQLQIQALLVVSLRKGQHQVIWALVSTVTTPRHWNESERVLLEQVSERTWAAIERARAEAALREAELQRVREQSAREEERQRAESLTELDRAKTTFFSNVSHEFRTPLTLSLAPLQDALSDRTHPLDPVQRERLELVHRNSLRLLKLVNTLLDFSRIEAGRRSAVYEPTDLATYTAELSSVFRSAIERAGLQLIVDCPLLPEPVYVDREMWEKIVLNLLSNALKFTFEGEIRVSLHSTGRNQAVLEIQDTGTGIAPEHLPHLFERFYQVRGTQARTQEGSGIGLALVYELVKLQGGTIEVSSSLGKGSCFTIALPFGTTHLPNERLASVQENLLGDRVQPPLTLASTAMGADVYVGEAEQWLSPRLDPPPPPLNRGENSIKVPLAKGDLGESPPLVLVVDDNADMREYLTRILSEHFQVEAVADGATALAVVQERVPDLILSDVMMPELDGFELLASLRSRQRCGAVANPDTREIPIILLSARAGVEAIVEGLAAGADDYLIKPFSAQELVSRVNTHLQIAQLRSEALQEARSAIRNKDEFISVVSHELNTPLVSILGWTRLLRSNPSSPVFLHKALDTIEHNAMLQAKLVQDLLDLSRISVGKFRLNPEPVELKSIVETAIATVAQTAAEKGVNLVWQQATTDPGNNSMVVMGDRDRLGQVICNLLTNAIKFTPTSGNVTIELSVINDDNFPNHVYAQICVSDTGIGIAPDFLPHVFDRFRQARELDSSKGLGLGLAIARHIVELHHGTIYAESAGVGKGATFIVRLPIHKPNPTIESSIPHESI